MATYKQIQDCVRQQHGWIPKTCWIAHVKELNGLPVRTAHNRTSSARQVPCPSDKRGAIESAMNDLGLLKG